MAVSLKHLNASERAEALGYDYIFFAGKNALHENRCVPRDTKNRLLLQQGDHVHFRFEVKSGIGLGAFGNVYLAHDHKRHRKVAIKIIRDEKRFHRAAQTEISVLERLVGMPHCVQFLSSFVFRGHPCIAFELLGDNLYAFLKGRGFRGIEVSDPLLRSIAVGTLSALATIRELGVIHADLKPENIVLVGDGTVKVIDFGSSIVHLEGARLPSYVQSRFYRSPEVLLGDGVAFASDMWSFGCIMYEMHLGHPLFPGRSQAQMIALQESVLGKPPMAYLARCPKTSSFYEIEDGVAALYEPMYCKNQLSGDNALFELIRRCLSWEPVARLRPSEALTLQFCCEGSVRAKEL